MNFYEHHINDIDGNTLDLNQYKNKTVLLVNVASRCGLTSEYIELQKLNELYNDSEFNILAFPCNQFKEQEPGSNQEIKNFCTTNYNVTFTLTEKIDVKGSNQHPIYKWIVANSNYAGDKECIRWNFTKFLLNKNGVIVKRWDPIDDRPFTAAKAKLDIDSWIQY